MQPATRLDFPSLASILKQGEARAPRLAEASLIDKRPATSLIWVNNAMLLSLSAGFFNPASGLHLANAEHDPI
jgi:hypothetical protein